MKTKVCTGRYGCGLEKLMNEFSIRSDNDNRRNTCQECIKEYQKTWYKENKEEISKQHKEYRDNNKEKITKRIKEWNKNNKVKIAKQAKIRNARRDKQKMSKVNKNRRQNDMNFRMKGNLRTRIYNALKGETKSLSTMFLIGCEADYLMYHLQSQFTKGMSWDNYGRVGWVVDHIKPCALFDLSKKSEQLLCFNYTNLQPLWEEDNLKKANKY
jgi:hypothetical protein